MKSSRNSLKRFWNISVQDGLRRTLTSGAYLSGGYLTRVNYATRLFGIAEDLKISKKERATIGIVLQHFAVDLRRLVCSQRICTRDDFLELLQ